MASPALDHGEKLLPLSFDNSGHNKQDCLAIVDPYEFVGHTFLMDPQDDGQCFHTPIVDLIEDHQSKVCMSDDHHKFRISVNDDQYEEVTTYNELMDFMWVVVISPMSLRRASTLTLCLYEEYTWLPSSLNSMVWNYGLPI
jgi:hypothetical protein